MESDIRVIAFAGSLRTGSLNRALLRAAAANAPDGMHVDVWDLADIPLFDGDIEAAGDPVAVVRFKRAIADADAMLIACPEYNHGVPGVLKNAIDWASRPPGRSPLSGKLAGIMGASPAQVGTARAQTQLRQAFNFTNTIALLQPEVLVSRAHEKFDAQGQLTDATTREFLGVFLVTFANWIREQQRQGRA